MNTIKGRIKEVIRPNGIGAITAAEHQALLLEVVDDVNKKKQDVIEDLDAIREGAQKGATAAQDIKTINEELGKKVNSSDLATINGLRIDEGGDIEIEGGMSEDEKAELNEKLTELSEGKADKNGKYADLTAGDLYGHGESVPAEFSFRASGGKSIKDGTAYIKEIQGNSVVWNQLLDGTWGGNYERDGDIVKVIGASYSSARRALTVIPIGHKVLFGAVVRGGKGSIQFQGGTQMIAFETSDSWKFIVEIKSIIIDNSTTFYLYKTGDDDVEFKDIFFHDLTKMFGAGNEPTTFEEYEARKPIVADEYAYNEGEVIPFTADGIKSVGDNAWDEQWELGNIDGNTGELISGNFVRSKNPIPIIGGEQYWCNKRALLAYNGLFCYDSEGAYIQRVDSKNGYYTLPTNAAFIRFRMSSDYGTTYNHDIMITLVHSGWKVDTNAGYQPYWADTLMLDARIKEAFPNGMMPWDKVYNKDGKGYIVKGSGSVDLGSAAFSEWQDGMYATNLADMAIKGQILCSKYTTDTYTNVTAQNTGIAALTDKGGIVIYDAAYTTPSALKASLQDVMLYYELAEPTIIEYDTPFQLDYKVADFGTEEIIGNAPSAPFKGRTIYQFNAVDQIRENYNEIEKIKAALAKAGITLDL